MALRKKVLCSAVVLACAPLAARAQTVLFSDNYDAGTSLGRYTFFSADREGTGTFGNGTFVGDTSANFNFNYGAYTYRTTDPNDGVTPITLQIPSAPNSTGGSTIGVRFDVNNVNTGTALIQALPKVTEYLGGVAPSGDHKLKFDVWMNYNGGFQGGGGSTEWFLAGVNQDGINPAGGSVGGGTFGVGQGLSAAVDGERGNSIDYRMYRANTRLDTIDAPASGYIAASDAVTAPPAVYGPADGRNAFYQKLFPFSSGAETPGSVGKVWRQVEMSYVDGIVYFTVDGNLISARSDSSATAGQDMIGYADFNNTSAANDDVTLVDANFGIFDNVVITSVTQTRPTWSSTGGGVWSDSGKWTNGVPDGGNTTADFTSAITGPAVITVDGTKTARSLVFDNANSYSLSGGTIVLSAYTQADIDTNPGNETVLLSGINGTLISRSGSHTIGSNIVLNTPLVATVNPGSTLAVTGDLITNNRNVTKAGGGTLVVKNVRTSGSLSTTGALTVSGGTLRVAANGTDTGVSNVSTLSIAGVTDAWTARVDLNNNSLVVDYTGSSPLATVMNQLKAGYNGGAWGGNGVDSSSAAAAAPTSQRTGLGYGEASLLVGPTGGSWKGQTVDGTAVLVTYTLYGDANLDKTVDTVDFNLLASNFGLTGKQWTDGDANYDGTVDTVDFNLLAANFAQVLPADAASLGALVPEPSSIALLAAAAPLLRRRRR